MSKEQKFEFHCKESCNKCGGKNNLKVVDLTDGYISECETTCVKCRFVDYWAHGYFESGSEIESKCERYYLRKNK